MRWWNDRKRYQDNCVKLEVGGRQGYAEFTTLTRCAGDLDISFMGPGNGSGKAQTQTDAGFRTAGSTAIKTFKNMRYIFLGNAYTGIFDRKA